MLPVNTAPVIVKECPFSPLLPFVVVKNLLSIKRFLVMVSNLQTVKLVSCCSVFPFFPPIFYMVWYYSHPLLQPLRNKTRALWIRATTSALVLYPTCYTGACAGNSQRYFIILLPLAPTHLPHSTIPTSATDRVVALVRTLFFSSPKNSPTETCWKMRSFLILR